jgi:hypothetical protein
VLVQVFIFKLEEEGNTALLLHLPKLFAESSVFWFATGLGCRLVVAIAQAVEAVNSFDKLLIAYAPQKKWLWH